MSAVIAVGSSVKKYILQHVKWVTTDQCFVLSRSATGKH